MPFAPGHDGWVLLNPGPACTSERVRAALLRGDLCHRESEFTDLLRGLQRKLRAALGLPPEYTVALVTGSGTAAMEMAVIGAVRPGRALAVVNNGVYGARMVAIARAHGIAVAEVAGPWTAPPPLDELAALLRGRDDLDALAVVHHETTTGLLNPVAEIGRLAGEAGIPLILDAISSMGCDPLDAQAVGADIVIGTANKGFHGLPGISFVYLSPRARARVAEVPPRSLYLHLGGYLAPQGRGDAPARRRRYRSHRRCRSVMRSTRRWMNWRSAGAWRRASRTTPRGLRSCAQASPRWVSRSSCRLRRRAPTPSPRSACPVGCPTRSCTTGSKSGAT